MLSVSTTSNLTGGTFRFTIPLRQACRYHCLRLCGRYVEESLRPFVFGSAIGVNFGRSKPSNTIVVLCKEQSCDTLPTTRYIGDPSSDTVDEMFAVSLNEQLTPRVGTVKQKVTKFLL